MNPFLILLVAAYHICVHNGLEKTWSQLYVHSNVQRPSPSCTSEFEYSKLSCVGMPSGHAETITILCLLLYFHNILPLLPTLLTIVLVSAERVIHERHTVIQVIFGIGLGLIYTGVYHLLGGYGFLVILVFGFLLSISIISKINVRQKIPTWVDPSMYSAIQKKQNAPYYLRLITIYGNAVLQDQLFLPWNRLENDLDRLMEKIRRSNTIYDAVVGIHTGGAILSDYISLHMKIPSYKIKLARTEYACNKQSKHTITDIITKNVKYHSGKYDICQGIEEAHRLYGKNVILIDESVSTGKTMEEAYSYLQGKHVRSIHPVCIIFDKKRYQGKLSIDYVREGGILIWPWGYDN